MRHRVAALFALALALAGLTAWLASPRANSASSPIHTIKHVIIIMQENRSFDEYFGTYPGADGIPMHNGVPAVCSPAPQGKACIRPYHSRADINLGGPHLAADVPMDTDAGRMDGFVRRLPAGKPLSMYFPPLPSGACGNDFNPLCAGGPPDVMGYHDVRELPNYWTYAANFVLHDHMYEPASSFSLVSHLYMVSGWSASCSVWGQARSCTNNSHFPYFLQPGGGATVPTPNYAWTDLTYLLDRYHVSWRYFVDNATGPYCKNTGKTCQALPQTGTPMLWNVLPFFSDVHGHEGNVQHVSQFLTDAARGTLPAVTWIAPGGPTSDHPAGSIRQGQTYVTHLINAVMRGPDWRSSAIFLAWDDWGGFYDHVVPPRADQNGYGFRVPSLLISPYARQGYIDHHTLSFDAYLHFIEDDFLGGHRLDPRHDGRPDPRPDVRERSPLLGNLLADFDFHQQPRPPFILNEHPPTDLLAPAAMQRSVMSGASVPAACLKASTVIGKHGPTLTVTLASGLTVTATTGKTTAYADARGRPTSPSSIKIGSMTAITGKTRIRGTGLTAVETILASRIQVLDGTCPTSAIHS